jgi:dTDP-4-dehydrorhamnose reductase
VHVAASGECTWYEFAVEIMRATHTTVEVQPVSTDQFPRPARRPAYSVMRSERAGAPILPDWHAGLSEYLDARVVA